MSSKGVISSKMSTVRGQRNSFVCVTTCSVLDSLGRFDNNEKMEAHFLLRIRISGVEAGAPPLVILLCSKG